MFEVTPDIESDYAYYKRHGVTRYPQHIKTLEQIEKDTGSVYMAAYKLVNGKWAFWQSRIM